MLSCHPLWIFLVLGTIVQITCLRHGGRLWNLGDLRTRCSSILEARKPFDAADRVCLASRLFVKVHWAVAGGLVNVWVVFGSRGLSGLLPCRGSGRLAGWQEKGRTRLSLVRGEYLSYWRVRYEYTKGPAIGIRSPAKQIWAGGVHGDMDPETRANFATYKKEMSSEGWYWILIMWWTHGGERVRNELRKGQCCRIRETQKPLPSSDCQMAVVLVDVAKHELATTLGTSLGEDLPLGPNAPCIRRQPNPIFNNMIYTGTLPFIEAHKHRCQIWALICLAAIRVCCAKRAQLNGFGRQCSSENDVLNMQ